MRAEEDTQNWGLHAHDPSATNLHRTYSILAPLHAKVTAFVLMLCPHPSGAERPNKGDGGPLNPG
jgi:hypothetical protein